MDYSCTVVIPTYSNLEGVKRILLDLARFLDDYDDLTRLRVIITDNSDEETQKELVSFVSRPEIKKIGIRLVHNLTNYGFAKSINQAVELATSDYILILNDDVLLQKTTIAQLVEAMKINGWDSIAPVLKNPKGKIENLGYRLLPKGKVELNFKPNGKVDGLSAACLLAKTQAFLSLGGFDEDFFAYLEDADFFSRFKQLGFSFGIANSVEVIHQHMVTSSKMGDFKQRMDVKNWFFLIVKNYSLQSVVSNFGGILVERLRNLNGLVKATSRQALPITLLAVYAEILQKLPKIILKRLRTRHNL